MDSDTGAYPNPPQWGGDHLGWVITLHGLLLLIAALVGAGIAYYLIKSGEQERLAKNRSVIFKAIRKRLDKALQARGPELVIAARELIKVTTLYLGPLFTAGRPISGPIDQINQALNGKTMDTSASAALPASAATTHASASTKEQGGATVITPSVVTNINVAAAGHDSNAKTDAPAKPTERDMTVPEQLDKLGKAIEALNRVWQPDTVDAFLAAAQKALLDVKPVDDRDDHKDDHGH